MTQQTAIYARGRESAFPGKVVVGGGGPSGGMGGYHETPGMTIREYLAAHAPWPPQDGWEPVLTQRPKRYTKEDLLAMARDDIERQTVNDWWDVDSAESMPQHIFLAITERENIINVWNVHYQQQYIGQWPWYWADAVLAAEERV